MKPAFPKWQKSGLVLVCERCAKERIPQDDPDKAAQIGEFHLRDWLKAKLKEDGLWGRVRAINTSCMDVCGKGAVTVVLAAQTDNAPSECFVVDPVNQRDELYEAILKKFG